MKDLEKLKKSLIKEIIIVVLLVTITVPIWQKINLSNYYNIAKAYENYNYVTLEKLNDVTYSTEKISDNDALAYLETTDLIVSNLSNTEDGYYLLLEMDKNAPIKSLRININYNIEDLTSYKYFEQNDKYYFLIDENVIKADSKKYTISFWNTKEDKAEPMLYDFILKKDITI